MTKRVLIVELNPYHGETLPGFVRLLSDCGYRADVLIRDEVANEDPFILMPKNERPHIISGSRNDIADKLKSGFGDAYDIVFFATNVFWEKDVNISSVFRYLDTVPNGKDGSLYIEHNLPNLEADDSTVLFASDRVATLLPYVIDGQRTRMINPHYFGDISFRKKPSVKRRIVIVGALSREEYVRNIINHAVRDHADKDFEIVIINGKQTDIPDDIRHKVTVTPRLNFKEYYRQIEDADFVLTVFNSNNPSSDKYLKGTTSGTIQISLGFQKPIIIDKTHAVHYGMTNEDSVQFAFNNLSAGLGRALEMSDEQYETMCNNLARKSAALTEISKANLREMIGIMQSRGRKFVEEADRETMTATRKNKEIEDMQRENERLHYEIRKQQETIFDLEKDAQDLRVHINELWTHLQSRHFVIADKLLGKFNTIAPPGSSRRRLGTTPLKGVKKITSVYDRQKLKAKLRRDKELLATSSLFDTEYYLQNNPDIQDKGIDPIEHYLAYGYKEGRKPSAEFDAEFYEAKYADVRNSNVNPLVHYLKFGKHEGRQPLLRRETVAEVLDTRIVIALQLDAFDRGGLEEVVLSLITNKAFNEKYKAYIFVTGDGKGYLADKARNVGVEVFALNNDDQYLAYLIQKLHVKVCNLHYSVFGIDTYKRLETKLVYTIHNNYVWADEEFQAVRVQAYQKIDNFVAVSDQVADFFSSKFSVDRSKITTVLNGVDSKKLGENITPQKRATFGLKKDDFVFVNVASFSPYKFQIDAIAAMKAVVKKYPNARLVMVGNVINAGYFALLQEKIVEYKLQKHVQLIDYLPKDELLGLLKQSDSFVLPSLTEGFSIAMIEAMYSELPLVLTDVGGARHAIDGEDIGIIIKNVYGNPSNLTQSKIDSHYSSDKNLTNLQDLSDAMISMITHKDQWRKKAKLGKKKVEQLYTIGQMVDGYTEVIDDSLYRNQDHVLKPLDDALAKVQRAFVAPFPSKERIREGWMSRINAIDQVIGDIEKIYVYVTETDDDPVITQYGEGQYELVIGTRSVHYTAAMERVINAVDSVYVHTLHLAEYALPWLESGKVVVDFHGVTPEEEVMLGRPYLKDKYEYIEAKVLQQARVCVMVTRAMVKHYEAKYPRIKFRSKVVILPIVENIKPVPRTASPASDYSEMKTVVYSGGIQVWQNLSAMLQLAKQTEEFATATFLSHEWQEVQRQGELLSLKPETVYEFCEKSKLKTKYAEFDFGFALRDDMAVNRVACPTKLYEYLSCGIIPVVRLVELGDFKELGYGFVAEADFCAGKFPSDAEIVKMQKQNYKVIEKMNATYLQGKKKLAERMSTVKGAVKA